MGSSNGIDDFVDGNVITPVETNPATHDYLYDVNGNMTNDKNKGISVTYNHLNLPETVSWSDGRKIEWFYDAGGAKLRQRTTFAGGGTEVTDYVGMFEYKDSDLKHFGHAEGRVNWNSTNETYEYEYHLKDHLGNMRAAFTENSITTSDKLTQERHYYPFGGILGQFRTETGGTPNKRLYNYKELVDDNNLYWYHYGARYYDPQLGRWWAVDPVDKSYSPYAFCINNPILFVDIFGMEWRKVFFENEWHVMWHPDPADLQHLKITAQRPGPSFSNLFRKDSPLATQQDPMWWQMLRGTDDIEQNVVSFSVGVPTLSAVAVFGGGNVGVGIANALPAIAADINLVLTTANSATIALYSTIIYNYGPRIVDKLDAGCLRLNSAILNSWDRLGMKLYETELRTSFFYYRNAYNLNSGGVGLLDGYTPSWPSPIGSLYFYNVGYSVGKWLKSEAN